MKGDAQPLIKFFDGSDKRFIIPMYQRNYDWKEENCEQLFQDLNLSIANHRLCIKQAPYFCLNIKSMGLVLILTQMTDLGLSGIT